MMHLVAFAKAPELGRLPPIECLRIGAPYGGTLRHPVAQPDGNSATRSSIAPPSAQHSVPALAPTHARYFSPESDGTLTCFRTPRS